MAWRKEVGGRKRSEEGDGIGVSSVHYTKWVYWYLVLFLAMDFYFVNIEPYKFECNVARLLTSKCNLKCNS